MLGRSASVPSGPIPAPVPPGDAERRHERQDEGATTMISTGVGAVTMIMLAVPTAADANPVPQTRVRRPSKRRATGGAFVPVRPPAAPPPDRLRAPGPARPGQASPRSAVRRAGFLPGSRRRVGPGRYRVRVPPCLDRPEGVTRGWVMARAAVAVARRNPLHPAAFAGNFASSIPEPRSEVGDGTSVRQRSERSRPRARQHVRGCPRGDFGVVSSRAFVSLRAVGSMSVVPKAGEPARWR